MAIADELLEQYDRRRDLYSSFASVGGRVLQSNMVGGKHLSSREGGAEFGGDSFEALFPFEMRDALHAAAAMVHLIRQHSQRLPLGEKVPDTFGEVTP